MGPKPSGEVDTAQKERCERATYIVRQANELGDESPLTVSYIRQALNLCPNNPAANVRMGILLIRQKDLDGARKVFKRALYENDRIAEVHYNLGILSRKEKKDTEAFTHFKRAVEVDPRNAPALYNLGVLQARAQERGQALDSFHKAIQADPKMAEAHFFLGALLQEQGEREKARTALQEAIKLNPRLALPHIYLAAILEADGKSQSSQEELSRAVRLNPASLQIGYNLDDFYAKEGGVNDFITHLPEGAGEKPASLPMAGDVGRKASFQDFGPRREAKEVPVPSNKKEPAPAPRAERAATPPPREAAPSPKRDAVRKTAPKPEPIPAPRREAAPPPRREAAREARLSPPQRKTPQDPTYRVRPGDTLVSIARRHGTSLTVLARLNRDRIEHPSMIEPGQEILLPRNTRRAPATARAARPAARRPAAPRETFRIHRVQRGETLARIARRYQTSVDHLMRLNRDRIEHASLLHAGQPIRVPAPRPAARK